ncbi:hypothetical protein WMF04_03445 [Sorangium sp. So ce260]|uniref:hypothetical protein n=1 Tax=Sorangium sp. So ce260 TaxID=3133291 RepID=UPI003F649039
MIYIRAGLFAEGRTDYDFLCPLLDRLLDALAADLFPGRYMVAPSDGIDAPRGIAGGRAEKIAAAIHERWEECTLFVIHADGAGAPVEMRRRQIDPGIASARALRGDRKVVAVACVPVREVEAWMLPDQEVFRALGGAEVQCPRNPERELDPKLTLRRLLEAGGHRRRTEDLYRFFGETIRLDALGSLPAFCTFRDELTTALRDLAAIP